MKKIQNVNSVFENLIYKKTVYSLKVKLNENNLISDRYFDFEKIPNLRVLDNGFLAAIRKKFQKTQKELADLVGVPLRTWIGWESYNKYLPFDKLVLLKIQPKTRSLVIDLPFALLKSKKKAGFLALNAIC